jgi:hypothetical protein
LMVKLEGTANEMNIIFLFIVFYWQW